MPAGLFALLGEKSKKAAEAAFFEAKLVRASRKPSSVRNLGSWVTIYLGLSLPAGSCDYQERDGPPLNAPIPILHRVGFTGRTSRQAAGELLPRLSILTAQRAAVYFCCTFPGVASAGRYPAPCPAELGLSSYGRAACGHLSYSQYVF